MYLKYTLSLPLLFGSLYFLIKGFGSVFKTYEDIYYGSKLTTKHFIKATGCFCFALLIFAPSLYLEAIFLFLLTLIFFSLRLFIQKSLIKRLE